MLAACRVRRPGVWSEPKQETLVPHSRRPPQGPPPSSCCGIRTTDPWDLRVSVATAPLRLQRPRERPEEGLQQQVYRPASGKAPMSPGWGQGQPGHQANGKMVTLGGWHARTEYCEQYYDDLGRLLPYGVTQAFHAPCGCLPWSPDPGALRAHPPQSAAWFRSTDHWEPSMSIATAPQRHQKLLARGVAGRGAP